MADNPFWSLATFDEGSNGDDDDSDSSSSSLVPEAVGPHDILFGNAPPVNVSSVPSLFDYPDVFEAVQKNDRDDDYFNDVDEFDLENVQKDMGSFDLEEKGGDEPAGDLLDHFADIIESPRKKSPPPLADADRRRQEKENLSDVFEGALDDDDSLLDLGPPQPDEIAFAAALEGEGILTPERLPAEEDDDDDEQLEDVELESVEAGECTPEPRQAADNEVIFPVPVYYDFNLHPRIERWITRTFQEKHERAMARCMLNRWIYLFPSEKQMGRGGIFLWDPLLEYTEALCERGDNVAAMVELLLKRIQNKRTRRYVIMSSGRKLGTILYTSAIAHKAFKFNLESLQQRTNRYSLEMLDDPDTLLRVDPELYRLGSERRVSEYLEELSSGQRRTKCKLSSLFKRPTAEQEFLCSFAGQWRYTDDDFWKLIKHIIDDLQTRRGAQLAYDIRVGKWDPFAAECDEPRVRQVRLQRGSEGGQKKKHPVSKKKKQFRRRDDSEEASSPPSFARKKKPRRPQEQLLPMSQQEFRDEFIKPRPNEPGQTNITPMIDSMFSEQRNIVQAVAGSFTRVRVPSEEELQALLPLVWQKKQTTDVFKTVDIDRVLNDITQYYGMNLDNSKKALVRRLWNSYSAPAVEEEEEEEEEQEDPLQAFEDFYRPRKKIRKQQPRADKKEDRVEQPLTEPPKRKKSSGGDFLESLRRSQERARKTLKKIEEQRKRNEDE